MFTVSDIQYLDHISFKYFVNIVLGDLNLVIFIQRRKKLTHACYSHLKITKMHDQAIVLLTGFCHKRKNKILLHHLFNTETNECCMKTKAIGVKIDNENDDLQISYNYEYSSGQAYLECRVFGSIYKQPSTDKANPSNLITLGCLHKTCLNCNILK